MCCWPGGEWIDSRIVSSNVGVVTGVVVNFFPCSVSALWSRVAAEVRCVFLRWRNNRMPILVVAKDSNR